MKQKKSEARSRPPTLVPAGEFKAKCLELMDRVRESGAEYVVTKRGTPVARLVEVDREPDDGFGALASMVVRQSDIVSAAPEDWADGST